MLFCFIHAQQMTNQQGTNLEAFIQCLVVIDLLVEVLSSCFSSYPQSYCGAH